MLSMRQSLLLHSYSASMPLVQLRQSALYYARDWSVALYVRVDNLYHNTILVLSIHSYLGTDIII